MNYPPPPPLQHPPQQSQPPSSYGPPMGPPPQYNSQRPAPPTASGAGLALQHPSQVESVPHYGGWAGQASPRSQNYYTIDRPTPTPTSASSSAVRTGASLSRKKSSSRISPGQMPRPDKPQTDLIYHTRSGTGRRNPPVVNSLYVAVDTGNANPRFLRSSMVAPPATPELLRGTGLPLALHVTPFAALAPGEDPVPEVDYGQSPPRCKRCSGYVSPFVTWLDNGHRWQCALCQTANATPDWYVSALDGSGQRLDRLQRPELTRGTVDFALPPSLFAEAPKENVVAFAVDVSYDAVQSGFALASLRAVHAVLRSLHQDYERRVARVREAFYQRRKQPTAADEAELAQALRGVEDWQVGVLTFHSQLQFYDVRLPPDGDGGGVALDAVRVLVGDADEPFCPLPPPRWLHRFSRPDGAARLFALLERLPSLLNALSLSTGGLPPRDPQRRFAAPTAAVVAVEDALRAQGGRLYVFATHHSTVGAGAAGKATREALGPGAHGSADELLLYSCPGAPCAFLDRVVSAGSGSAGGGGGGGLLGSVLSLAGGVNNAGNGVDRKVAAVATGGGRALPTVSSTASLAALAASPSSASAGGGGGGGGGGAREKLREARVTELQTAAAWHWRLAEACAAAALSVSTFVGVGDLYDEAAAPRLFDTTQAADLALRTGGKVFVARGSMRAEDHVAWMENQLAHELLRGGAGYAGRDVTAKLRASRHVALEQFYGGGAFDALDEEWRLPAADAATSATFALALTGALRDEERVYLQFAAMYTTPARQRRIRVHNVALHASEKATTVYRNCDIEAIVGALARVAAHRALEQPLGAEPGGPRSFLTAALVDVLVKYRQLCSSASPKGQLVLPESLKVLPMLVLGLLKHPAFVENVAAGPAAPARLLSHASERACELRRLFAQPLRELVNSAHPRVYNLFALLDADRAATATGDGDGDEDDDAAVGSEDDVDGLDDDDAELSPERQEDRSHWTLARSASFPQEAGALAASQSSTRLDMLAVATGVPAAQPPLLPPPPPPLSTPPAPLPVVTGPPLYSFPTSYPPPPSTLPPPAAPPTAPLYAPPSLPPPQPSLSPAASLASLSPPPLSLAGYAMASAVASDYSAAPAAALSASGQLRLSVPPKTRRQRPFRPLRLLRRQGGVHTARRLKLLALQTLQGSSAEFESDQIYVVDDRSLLWLYVGRAVSQELLEELFVLPAQAPFERPAEVGVRTTTALGRRMRLFLDLLVADAPQKPELRVVWADLGAQNRLLHKFSTRLLEDAAGGALSYTDFLCSVHSKIQARL